MALFLPTARTSDRGATAAEYALMAALIALAIFSVATALGLNLEALFSDEELLNTLNS